MNYHYSTILHLPYILMSGELQTSRREAHGHHKEGLLWFSSNRQMELTAVNSKVAMVRFGTRNAQVKAWRTVARAVGFNSGTLRRLEKSGRKMGAKPSEWLAINGSLPLAEVDVIEIKGARGWQGLDRDALQVVRLQGGSVQLIGPGGTAAVIGRQRTHEGYFAYGTNMDLYHPERLMSEPAALLETA